MGFASQGLLALFSPNNSTSETIFSTRPSDSLHSPSAPSDLLLDQVPALSAVANADGTTIVVLQDGLGGRK